MTNPPALRLARLLPESELSQTGCAAPTGLQLSIAFDHLQGRSVEAVAAAFGYSSTYLDRLSARGDGLVVVIAEADSDAGLATDVALGGLLRDLRPEEGEFSDLEVAEALDTQAGRAGMRIRQVQAALQRVFGIRDPLFGQSRFASARWADRQLKAPFYLDEKVDMEAIRATRNPLLPGSALRLEAYPSMPLVQRLPWPPESS